MAPRPACGGLWYRRWMSASLVPRRLSILLLGLSLVGCAGDDGLGESDTVDETATATATASAGTGNTESSTGSTEPTTTGESSAGTTDAGTTSAGTTSAGTTDGGTTSAGTTSAGTTDGGTTDGGTTEGDTTGVVQEGCSEDAAELVTLLNAYRAEKGKPPIPLSPSLCIVGDTHAQDLVDNSPDAAPECNLHSWSDAGSWSPCCYTADHAQAKCMWDKPKELTSYPGNGYENAASGAQGPAAALELWKGSPAHNDVILNQGIWKDFPWGAVGAGFEGGYAVLWFGQEADPAG